MSQGERTVKMPSSAREVHPTIVLSQACQALNSLFRGVLEFIYGWKEWDNVMVAGCNRHI